MKLAICVLLLAATLCAAEPLRYRNDKRLRFSARQELAAAPAAPAPTGYPAAGVRPEVPFELPTEAEQPDMAYLPPDNTYGPPAPAEQAQPDNSYGPPQAVYGPPATAAAPAPAQPDNSYGPPTDAVSVEEAPLEPAVPATEEQPPAPASEQQDEILVKLEDGTVIAIATSYDEDGNSANGPTPARLVYQRFPQGNRSPLPSPARLVQVRRMSVASPLPAKLQFSPAPAQAKPLNFAYNSRLQSW